jgi:predicted AlkP superfamily phosphohydrolase/phosphomutase
MIYQKIVFTYGSPVSEGYMEIDESIGQLNRLIDLNCKTLNIESAYGYFVIDTEPPKPSCIP